MSAEIDGAALAQIFLSARTHNGWLDKPVPDELLVRLVDLMKLGPTAANSEPGRIVFVKSPEAKARLKPLLSEGNVDKTMSAPVTAVIGYDVAFHDHLPRLFPHSPSARDGFIGEQNIPRAQASAFRNGTLQGAYLMLAARALGLDCGPMSGFDAAAVDAAFFADQRQVRVNFISTLGYGDPAGHFDRSPRPPFDRFNRIV